jgi:hypothetical protein
MDLIWILTGGHLDFHSGERKIYNLLEVDEDLEIKLSYINTSIYTVVHTNQINESVMNLIHEELDEGKMFLCKNKSYDLG